MMSSETNIALLALLLLGATTFAVWRGLTLLAAVQVTMMICIPLLGASTFTAFGYSSNIGNVFFAVAMHGISLTFLLAGRDATRRSIGNTFAALIIVLVSILILQQAHLVSPLFDARVQFAAARIMAFSLVQPIYVYLLGRPSEWPYLLRAPLISIAMQGLDCLVFFPDAFIGVLPSELMLQFALVGFATRLFVTLLTIPFMVFSLVMLRGGMLRVF